MKVLRSIGLPVALLCLTTAARPGLACLLEQAPLSSPIQEDPSATDPSSPTRPTKASTSATPQTLARVRALDAQASQLKTRGKYDEAESLYRQSLALNEATLGPDHPEVGASLNNLAALCEARGNYAEANRLFQRAITIKEKLLPPDHPSLAVSLNNVATVYFAQGEYGEVEALYQRSLK